MNDVRLVLEPAKRALGLCVCSVVLMLAVVIGLTHYHKTRATVLAQMEGELQGARQAAQTMVDDLASLAVHLQTFERLERIGLIGEPPRDAWVQGLESIYAALALPPTLHYALAPPRPLADQEAAGALPTSSTPTNTLRHDFEIELSGIHEGEFLNFIMKLSTDWQAPFRIETCQMKEAAVGVQGKCTLRLFSIPLVTNGQPAGG